MKRLLSACLAGAIIFLALAPAGAIEVRQTETPVASPRLLPAQLPQVSVPQTTAIPSIEALPLLPGAAVETADPTQPAIAPTQPAPPSAAAQLQTAGQALSPSGPNVGPAAETAGRGFFDGANLRQRAADAVTMAPAVLAAHFVSIFPNALAQGTPVHPLAMAAVWYGASEGMASTLADARRTVVGGWQASHDQSYRVDPNTGLLRDVRGRKYGEDRYEEYAPGKVSTTERLLAAALSAGMGLLWVGGDLKNLLLYGASLSFLTLAAALIRSRRPPSPPLRQSEEDKAHAARFDFSRSGG
jgi:hypothetical protein